MKKRNIIITASIAFMSLTLTGCAYIFDRISGGDVPSENFDVDKDKVNSKTVIKQSYKELGKHSPYLVDYCPNKGNVKLLIIPVWFSDSNTYIDTSKKSSLIQYIEKAYLGTNDHTGWRSVKTYYEELSNGALTITGKVSDWYSVSYSVSKVGKDDSLTDEIVKNATNWYFTNNPSDSRSNYDSDNDGYIDGVMIIYGAPDYAALNRDDLSNLWAYAYWLQEENDKSYPIPNAYFWASYDFMFSAGTSISPTPAGSKYGSGDTTYCNVDTHTYIHEMGHLFGLDDYYDYGTNKYCPAGGFSMQDYNVGCHDPYSAMALGWADPYVVSGNAEVTIGTFQKTRELLVISEKWNESDSPFDEYLIMELYSPTGLNEFDSQHTYADTVKGPNKVGIRLWHVDARLVYINQTKTTYINGQPYEAPVYKDTNLTSNVKDSRAKYGVVPAFSNTYDDEDYGSVLGSDYYEHNLLQLIRNNRYLSRNWLKNTINTSDLFTSGAYSLSYYKDQFVYGSSNKMNNGTSLGWSFKISIEGSDEKATAKIEIIKN